jgi:class 3 adenylate cyclase/tetratricopeptide (TPR) repeat protein
MVERDATRNVPASEAESERRQATVLFADISGFTSMSARMDPEDVTATMNDCFEMLGNAVQSHGGHVDKFIGDCIMAVFGAPKALEDAPRQAVNAAIEMRRRLDAMNRERRFAASLGIHTGINTGLVLAGHVGSAGKRDFTVMGDVVNVASRLKDAAPNGAIWVGAETYRYTADDFEYRQLAPQKVKGKDTALVAYEVLSASERIHRTRLAPASDGVASVLVGRDSELRQLRECVQHVRDLRGGIVSLTGEAGMGKSRLLSELVQQQELRDVEVLEGRSLAVGQRLAFHTFADLFRQWAEIVDEDGDQAAIARLESAIGGVVGEGSSEVVPFVATLMGLRLTGAHAQRIAGIEGESLETLIAKSVRDLLRRLAATRPLVLVFEDVHWADLSSVKLLEFLLGLALDTAILFVLAMRPDHPATSQRLVRLARERWPRQLVALELQPLDATECNTLIDALLEIEDLPYSARTMISRKAEGNPFFIEEVIRSLVSQGVVERHQGRFRLTAPIESVVIPGTIQEVIMTRVDRLPDRPRRVLQTASVIGRRFAPSVLVRVLGDEEQLEWALGQLKRSQLLDESTAGDEIEYVFKHALIQEVVYESILQRSRRELHVSAAQAIEALFPDRLLQFHGMLAYHYGRGGVLEKAEEHLLAAGEQAARSAAPSEALDYFREASRIYLMLHGDGDPAKRALLERNIALALFQTGNLTESIDHFDRALGHLGQRVPGSTAALTWRFVVNLAALLTRLYVRLPLGRPSPATDRDREIMQINYTRARAQMTSDPRRYFFDSIGSLRRLGRLDPATVDQACGMYAGGAALFAYSGISFRIGRRFLDVASGLVRDGNVHDEFFYRTMRFVCDYLEGTWDDERAIDERLVEEALRRGLVWDIFVYRGLNAERLAHRGAFEASEREIARLKELSEAYGFVAARSNEYAMSAVLEVERGRLATALEHTERYYASQHEDVFHLFALATKAKIQLLSGDRAAAGETVTAGDDLVRRMGRVNVYHLSVHRTSRLLYDVTALEAAIQDGRPSRALVARATRSARLALPMARRVARERPEIYRLAGRLAWLRGREKRALGWWERSLGAAERLGARPEIGRTYAEVGRALGASRHAARLGDLDAASCAAAARRVFEELNLDEDGAPPQRGTPSAAAAS